jgi:LCP family protein required for cell wall assembly
MNKVKHFWNGLKRTQKIMIIISIAFLVLIGTGIWYYATVIDSPYTILPSDNNPFDDPTVLNPDDPDNPGSVLDNFDPEKYYDKHIVNFVLLGFDTSDARRDMPDQSWYGMKGFAGGRPDSIRVISINLDTNTSAVISIPRDTYIQIANTSTKDKVNSSYMYGRLAAHQQGITDDEEIDRMGLEYVMKTISNVLGGLPMDYYMAIDFDTVVNFVDAIGGVKYNVDIEVRHPQTGELMLEKGEQILSGTQAFIYLQDRYNTTGGDLGRTQHHTMFLKAMMKQLLQNGKIIDALKMVILHSNELGTIETNMSTEQLMAAGNIAAKRLNLNDINPYTIACNNNMKDGISYVVMDQEARSELIKEIFDYDYPVQQQERLGDTVPKPPINFTGSLTKDGVVLSWALGDSYNRAYVLSRNGSQIATNLTETLYLDTGYSPGTITYELQAINGEAVSDPISCTVQAGPTAPTNFKASFDSLTKTVLLTWDYSGHDVTFTIYKGDGDGTGRRIASKIKDRTYADAEVEYNKTYTYWVTAVKSDGTESARTSVSIETIMGVTPTPLPTPTILYTLAMDVNDLSMMESLTPGIGAHSYESATSVGIMAESKSGYRFVEWKIEGDASLQEEKTEIKNTVDVSGVCTVRAIFAIDITPTPTPLTPDPSISPEPSMETT